MKIIKDKEGNDYPVFNPVEKVFNYWGHSMQGKLAKKEIDQMKFDGEVLINRSEINYIGLDESNKLWDLATKISCKVVINPPSLSAFHVFNISVLFKIFLFFAKIRKLSLKFF